MKVAELSLSLQSAALCRLESTTYDIPYKNSPFPSVLMLHDLSFLYKTSTKFFIKPFHIVCGEMMARKCVALLFIGNKTNSSNERVALVEWRQGPSPLYPKQAKCSFYTSSLPQMPLWWGRVNRSNTSTTLWQSFSSWPNEIPENFPLWNFKQNQ